MFKYATTTNATRNTSENSIPHQFGEHWNATA